jgi:hypothetical protein
MAIPGDHEKITTWPQKDHKEITATGDRTKILQGQFGIEMPFQNE